MPDDIDAGVHHALKTTLPQASKSLEFAGGFSQKGLQILHSSAAPISSYVPGSVSDIGANAIKTIEKANDIGLGAAKDGIKSAEHINVLTDGDSSGFEKVKASAGLTKSGAHLVQDQISAAVIFIMFQQCKMIILGFIFVLILKGSCARNSQCSQDHSHCY